MFRQRTHIPEKALTGRDIYLGREHQWMASLSACPADILFEHTKHAAPEPAFTTRLVEAIQVLIGARCVCPKARARPDVLQWRIFDLGIGLCLGVHMLGAATSFSWGRGGVR